MKGDKHLFEIKEARNQRILIIRRRLGVFMEKGKGNNYINGMKEFLLVLVN